MPPGHARPPGGSGAQRRLSHVRWARHVLPRAARCGTGPVWSAAIRRPERSPCGSCAEGTATAPRSSPDPRPQAQCGGCRTNGDADAVGGLGRCSWGRVHGGGGGGGGCSAGDGYGRRRGRGCGVRTAESGDVRRDVGLPGVRPKRRRRSPRVRRRRAGGGRAVRDHCPGGTSWDRVPCAASVGQRSETGTRRRSRKASSDPPPHRLRGPRGRASAFVTPQRSAPGLVRVWACGPSCRGVTDEQRRRGHPKPRDTVRQWDVHVLGRGPWPTWTQEGTGRNDS